ncbi:tetratricopeptide repeat protein [Nannocystaceae bacterium ST9]
MTTNAMMRRRSMQVTEQLLGELEAGRFDSALTKRIVEAPGAFSRLLRACFLVEQGLLAQARADVDAALVHAKANPVIEMVAGLLLFITHDYQRALEQFASAAGRSAKAARRARQMALGAAGALGWEQDVRELLDQAIADEPTHASWHAQAVRFYVRGRWWQRALAHAEAALELEPANPSLWMEAAGLHATLDHRAQALDALERALALAPEPERTTYLREAGRVAIDASAFVRARECFEAALEREPDQLDIHVRLAELAAWRDDHERAREWAERALALRPDHPPALRVLGGLEVRAKRWDAASELLERAIAGDPKEYQAHVWLTEVFLRTDRFEQAHAQLHQGTMNSGGYLFVAWMLRFLIVGYERGLPTAKRVEVNRTEEFEQALRELAPDLAERAFESRDLIDLVAAVEAGLAALRGNRSIHATHLIEGELVRLHARSGCRFESRWALQLLRVATPSECLAELDRVVAEYPGSSLPVCHRGELHLWRGDWPAARRDLEQAIAAVLGTRWAYMGLSTIDLIAGDYDKALAVNAQGVQVMRNTEGPAIYVFRGEAKRKLGRIDEAVAELEKAVEWHPARASATINLALAFAAQGRLADLRRLWQRLTFEQANGLMSDAAHELGVTIVGDPDWEPTLEVMVAVLERALTMMGGNRSSGLLTYWTARGRLRFVQHWPHGGRGPHERDREHAGQAKQMLLKALSSYTGPRPP